MTPLELAKQEQLGVYTEGGMTKFESQQEYQEYLAITGQMFLLFGAIAFGVGWLVWRK